MSGELKEGALNAPSFLVTRLGLLVTRLGREDIPASIAIKYLIAT